MQGEFTVTVPATTANLGPGYGVLGLAVTRSLTARISPRDDGKVLVERKDEPSDQVLDLRHDPVLRGLRAGAEAFEVSLDQGLEIAVEGDVPRGCGLGTVSAAYAVGLGTAVRMAKEPADPSQVLDLLVGLGGDPAHGAASLTGGLVAALPLPDGSYRLLPKSLADGWKLVFALPNVFMSTAATRKVLPASLPHGITARTAGRLLGLLQALAFGDEDLLGKCIVDEVHVPYRKRMVPGMETALAAGREAGAAGTTLSGHGPGIVAFTMVSGAVEAIGAAMVETFEQAGVDARSLVLEPAQDGCLLRHG